MKNLIVICLFQVSLLTFAQAQMTNIVGTVQEKNAQGAIKNVEVKFLDAVQGQFVANTLSDENGNFSVKVPSDKKYKVVASKKTFFDSETNILADDNASPMQIALERKPGYMFDVSINDASKKHSATVPSIEGARIEVFNNTTGKEELSLNNHPQSSFTFNFEEGNHYTIMIRKKGFLNKRIEAYVNISGCILCFEGLGKVNPVDVMANENQLGAFLASVEMEPLAINKTFQIKNIYYDYDKWDIRPDAALELDKLVTVLKDNPAITIELGSHTDARGKDPYNMTLSEKRAAAAVDYLVSVGGIDANKLTHKGYGESRLVNRCDDGVNCSEDAHQENRRTELKITGIEEEDPLDKKTLKMLIQEMPRNNQAIYEHLKVTSNTNLK